MKKLTVGILLFMSIHGAIAQTMFGDKLNCGQWVTRNQRAGSVSLTESWVLGFLSGMNTVHVLEDKKDVLAQLSSSEQVTVWVDNYCKANPLDSLSMALVTLFVELRNRASRK